ncbi:DUF551 domain-containing protein [Klebsiella pneumoniae]|uniref:DUF551 domain-containing protein n=1 Tax=Klebsiella pneumoniae TaxID=573 RepID=UPI003B021CDD
MCELWDDLNDRHAPPVVVRELARMALAAMDSSESVELPLDYLQGHKDGLEWAAQLAEANHPETGDWLYDDPIELAKAIRKGPDMPPAQPVADSEPVAYIFKHPAGRLFWALTDESNKGQNDVMPVYASPQPAPVVPEVDADDNFYSWFGREWAENYQHNQYTTAAKQMLGVMAESAWKAGRRAAMLAAAPQSPGSEPATAPGKWIPVSERMPEIGDIVLTAMGGVVNVGETERSAANCRFFTSVISGRELPATHWMPLPAAPQEVKGE